MNLRAKMLVGILGTSLIIFAVVGGVVVTMSRTANRQQAERLSVSQTRESAERISNIMTEHISNVQVFLRVLQATPQREGTREVLAAQMGAVMRDMPEATSFWMIMEKNAFDGGDAHYAGKTFTQKAGVLPWSGCVKGIISDVLTTKQRKLI